MKNITSIGPPFPLNVDESLSEMIVVGIGEQVVYAGG
jgi:hypothetical protein